jgi:hypothetical protein
MLSRETTLFGVCTGLGLWFIVLAQASIQSIMLVTGLLVILLVVFATRWWWP